MTFARFDPGRSMPPDRCDACPLRRLDLFTPSDEATVQQIEGARGRNVAVESGQLIHVAGQLVEQAFTLFDGYAITYRLLDDGARQVTRFALPGDLIYFQNDHMAHWTDTTEAVGPAILCAFPASALAELFYREIHIVQALASIREAEEEMLEEHMTDLGRRSSEQKVARLHLEIFHRQRVRGRSTGTICPFPFTQEQVGDALGLSGAHVNRVLSALRREGVMEVKHRTLSIADPDATAERFDFDPVYMHPRPLI